MTIVVWFAVGVVLLCCGAVGYELSIAPTIDEDEDAADDEPPIDEAIQDRCPFLFADHSCGRMIGRVNCQSVCVAMWHDGHRHIVIGNSYDDIKRQITRYAGSKDHPFTYDDAAWFCNRIRQMEGVKQ